MGLFSKPDKVKQKLLKQYLSESELLVLIPLMKSSDAFHLCRQSQASAKVLVEALKYIDEVDARYAFRNVKMPVREIQTWSNRYLKKWNDPSKGFTTEEYEAFFENMKSILGNLNCPTDILDKFFDLGVKEFDNAIARNRNVSSKVFNLIISMDNIELLENLCRNEGLSKTQINKLVKLPYPRIHKVLIENPIISEESFQNASLSSSPNADEIAKRIKEAKSKSITKSKFLALSRDTNTEVRIALSTNKSFSSGMLESWLAHETELDVLLSIYEHQYLSDRAEQRIFEGIKDAGRFSKITEDQSKMVEKIKKSYYLNLLNSD
jgi:hypothetical protein